MGTNYYLYTKPACPTCGHRDPPRHIGKSSGGWCFGLHVYPEDGINTLDDWRALLEQRGSIVENEYGERVAVADLLVEITERAWPAAAAKPSRWYADNHAVPGPNRLARSRIDGAHCIGHGEGTWDYLVGEFS